MFRRSEGGERSRRRKGIARNMLRGESCGGGCGDRDDRAALLALGFAPAEGKIFDDDDGGDDDDDARGASRRDTGVWDTFGDDEDVDVDVLVLVVWASSAVLAVLLGGEGETAVPKGVSSIFTLEEDATFLVAGWCIRDDCAAARALSLRWWCVDRWWLNGGTVRNCPEVDMVAVLRSGVGGVVSCCVVNVDFYTTLRSTFGVRCGQSMSSSCTLLGDGPKVNAPPKTSFHFRPHSIW